MLSFDRRTVTTDLIFRIFLDFADELEKQLMNGKKPTVYEGIADLLIRLQETENIFLGLVTGNIQAGARIKLQAAGLPGFFEVGGYGDDAKNRNDLPPIAISRAEKFFRQNFPPTNTWIIGDSIHDIYCTRANHLRCLAVSTGWTKFEELQEAKPDHLFQNLAGTDDIFKLLILD